MDCLEALGRWDVLCDTFGPEIPELTKPENRDSGLSVFVHAATRDDRYLDALVPIVDSADASLQKWLTANNAQDVSVAYLLRNDLDRASGALTRCITHIVDAWSSLSPLACKRNPISRLIPMVY